MLKNDCGQFSGKCTLPGGRCPGVCLPATSNPMLFCTPCPPPCCPKQHSTFTCNPCDCPKPRACCKPPPPCNASDQEECQSCPSKATRGQTLANDEPAPYPGYLPPCPPQVLLKCPSTCPTYCNGWKCTRIHANPPPTIQPIQIWGCTAHKFQ